jgi:enoyl-CoA hydratase
MKTEQPFAGVYLVVDVVDGLLHITINRPEKLNALSSDVLKELHQAMDAYASDEALIAAVITGAGEKCFAAGGDLKELDRLRSESDAARVSARGYAALEAIRDFPVPVIAALNGDAIGGGAELAVSCDMRVFASHARIAFVQGLMSISPAWGGGSDLIRIIGGATALRLLARSEFVGAQEALSLGLAQAVAAPDETVEEAMNTFLEPIRAKRPQVMRAFKALAVQARKGGDPSKMRELEGQLHFGTWCHPDHWEAHDRVLAKISE